MKLVETLCLGASGFLLWSAIARADIVYVSTGDEILKFNSSGSSSVFATSASGANYPNLLTCDNSGNLYAGNEGSPPDIEKFTPSGVGSVYVGSVPGYSSWGLAFDNSGNLYVADQAVNSIGKFTPAGTGTTFASINDPLGLAFDNAGNLYAVSGTADTIMRFNSSGVGSVFASGLISPVGLAFDSSGNLYVAEASINTILKINSSGVGSVFATAGLDSPRSLAFDSSGNLFVENANINHTASNTIMEFTPNGVGSVFASGLEFPEGIAIVPEPSTGAICVAGAVVWLSRTRGKSKKR